MYYLFRNIYLFQPFFCGRFCLLDSIESKQKAELERESHDSKLRSPKLNYMLHKVYLRAQPKMLSYPTTFLGLEEKMMKTLKMFIAA